MPRPYDVLDVAHLVVKICSENNTYIIPNLKLQTILYFVQAYFLVDVLDSIPCFHEPIEARAYGPVVKKAYDEYKIFGGGSIPYSKFRYESVPDKLFDIKKIPYNERAISNADAKHISDVVNYFGNYGLFQLVEITRRERSPWRQYYQEGCNNIITHESIKKYYKK